MDWSARPHLKRTRRAGRRRCRAALPPGQLEIPSCRRRSFVAGECRARLDGHTTRECAITPRLRRLSRPVSCLVTSSARPVDVEDEVAGHFLPDRRPHRRQRGDAIATEGATRSPTRSAAASAYLLACPTTNATGLRHGAHGPGSRRPRRHDRRLHPAMRHMAQARGSAPPYRVGVDVMDAASDAARETSMP